MLHSCFRALGVLAVLCVSLYAFLAPHPSAQAQTSRVWYRTVYAGGGISNMAEWEEVPAVGSTSMNIRDHEGLAVIVRRESPSAATIQLTMGEQATTSAVDCAAAGAPRRATLQYQRAGQENVVQVALRCSPRRPVANDLGVVGHGPML